MYKITLHCDCDIPEKLLTNILGQFAEQGIVVNGSCLRLDEDMEVRDSLTITNNYVWRRYEEEHDDGLGSC
jgi:hypothetical protein